MLAFAAIALLFFALLSLRPAAEDARTPAEMRAAVRRAGAIRTVGAVLRVTLIVVLLLLVEACRISWQAATALAFVLTVLAHGIDALGRTSIAGGRAA